MGSKTDLLSRLGALALVCMAAGLLAGCEDDYGATAATRAYRQVSPETLALMEQIGTTENAPVLIRTYKKEAEFEIWKQKADGRYALLKTYPMCRWSGQLGPKMREGDRQVPEGFYTITPGQMNPNSAYYLSFNVGYPNAFDRAWNRTGGSIMVHGVCSSAGCYSMTDEQIAEIYAIAREAFNGGQHAIQMQSFPFHMTAENMAKYRLDPNIAFWKQIKEGADAFEASKREVSVGVCNRHYVFNMKAPDGTHLDPSGPCPALTPEDEALQADVAAKAKDDEAKVAELVAKGLPAIHTVYADGGQNPAFAKRDGEVSRPEALAQGPVDQILDDGTGHKPGSPVVKLATKLQARPVGLAAAPGTGPAMAPVKMATATTKPASVPANAPLALRKVQTAAATPPAPQTAEPQAAPAAKPAATSILPSWLNLASVIH